MYSSRSVRWCSCSNPIACISSWMTVHLRTQLSLELSETTCTPPLTPVIRPIAELHLMHARIQWKVTWRAYLNNSNAKWLLVKVLYTEPNREGIRGWTHSPSAVSQENDVISLTGARHQFNARVFGEFVDSWQNDCLLDSACQRRQ